MYFVTEIQQNRDSLIRAREELLKEHPNWESRTDTRLTVFSKCINILNSTQLGMIYTQSILTDRTYWQSSFGNNISDEDDEIYIREFDMFI